MLLRVRIRRICKVRMGGRGGGSRARNERRRRACDSRLRLFPTLTLSLCSTAAVAPGKDGVEEYEEIREQDRFLPIANIARIMKNTLPENAKIAKDAKETVQECVSEFISFITSEASDKCMHEKRKTINGDDLLWAMSTLGFDKYVEPLKVYLAKYREAVKGEKPEKGKEEE